MFIIGVDGGGTKTAAEVFEVEKNVIKKCGSAVAGPMNYNFIGVDAAVENLMSAIHELGISPEKIEAIGIGDPAIDDYQPQDSKSPTAQFIEKVRQRTGAAVYLRSDAYITLFGLTGGKEPAVLQLAGTGAMAIAQNADFEVNVAGGWGRITGDEGSGFFIASEGIKAALRAADGIGPYMADGIGQSTALTQAALDYFEVKQPRDLIGIFYGEPEPDIAGFSKAVAECAEKGDAAARVILHEAAAYLAAYTSRLIEWSGSRKVGVYGSVICKNAAVRQEYEAILRKRYGDITITEPPVSATEAAALYAAWALDENNRTE